MLMQNQLFFEILEVYLIFSQHELEEMNFGQT